MTGEAPHGHARSPLERLSGFLTKRSTPSDRPITDRRWLFAVALALFALTTVIAWVNLPESETELRWALLVLLVVVGTPANLAVTGYEFVVMARLLGITIESGPAARVAILSSAANLLPLPGSVLVRALALRERGAAYRAIGAAVASMAVGFLTMTGLVCGTILLLANRYALAGVLLGGGILGVALLWVLTRTREAKRPIYAVADVLASQTLLIIVVALRLLVVLPALGYAASATQSAALAAASVAATATGVFPAGLGIRELFSGAAASLVELPVSVGVIAGATDRIALGLGLLPIGLALMWQGRGDAAPAP